MPKKRPRKKQRCGTAAGRDAHLRRCERPCRECLMAAETYTDAEISSMISEFRNSERDKRLRDTYGLAQDTFELILKEQNNRCACCHTAEPGKQGWHVDHDHQTGLIRGILCSNCNTGIEMLGDGLVGVERAALYLREHHNRDGHKISTQPPALVFKPSISAIMQQCFDYLKKGVPCTKIIIALKISPSSMIEIYELWKDRYGTDLRPSEHHFRILKDKPRSFGCGCTCGYAAYCLEWDRPSVEAAISEVNQHILAAKSEELAAHRKFERDALGPPRQ